MARTEKQREWDKTYREANREKINGYHRTWDGAYREANRDEYNASRREWRAANGEKVRAYNRAYYAANRERILGLEKARCAGNKEHRAKRLRARKYGLTHDEFITILASQAGRCAICRTVLDGSRRNLQPQVDHDHDTGAVRGLLCGNCNKMLGMAKDQPEVLGAAIAYLAHTLERVPG